MSTKPQQMEALHGETIVARIEIAMTRAGNIRVAGQITDEKFFNHMIDTARDTMKGVYSKQKLMNGSIVSVPASDTSLVGSPEEKALLKARDELDNARVRVG